MGNKNSKAYATFEAFDNDANEIRLNDTMDDPIEVVFREGRMKLSNEDDPDYAYRKGLEDMYHYVLSKVVPETEGEEGIVTEENSLKTLVGKSDDEELDLDDARTIGKKISKMHGDDRKKFIGIVNFMGASCRIYNEIWANYKPVDPSKKKSNKGKEFRGDKEIG